MPNTEILNFLTALKENNNREWFASNKDWYIRVKDEFETLGRKFILEISKFDEDIKHVDLKDCVFRIYRDTRFSNDKTPYKTHMGVYIAAGGGRKSPRGGYYVHFEPNASFIAAGVWCPEPNILKALRKSVYENIDEFNEIRNEKEFARYFSNFFDEDKLKNVPAGFPKDFPEAEFLKLKHYIAEYQLDESLINDKDFVSKTVNIFKSGYPLNRFLNYTVDAIINGEE